MTLGDFTQQVSVLARLWGSKTWSLLRKTLCSNINCGKRCGSTENGMMVA